MPGRSFSSGSYRYGFNGKENDNEVKGESNQQDYGMRIYDPRLGRFLSVDPITKQYPELTPYQFASNNPIDNIDLDGLEGITSKIQSNGTFSTAQSSTFRVQPQIKVATAKVVREETWAMADIHGNGHIGFKSQVLAQVADVKQEYRNAVGDNIRGGLFGALGYYVAGERGTFHGAALDGLAMSISGIKEPAFLGPKAEVEEVSVIETDNIRFSQESVNGLGEIVSSMRRKGWSGAPIDVIELEDGKFGTLDNTRVLAAHEAGIDVEAIVHKRTELLTPSEAERFTTKKRGILNIPKTWEDAYKNRIGKQSAAYRKANPNGSYTTRGNN